MSARKILFVDRDGTLIVEPADQQIDAYEKLALVDDVIPALARIVAAGYELVMITNQDGLGTDSFPQHTFDGPHELMMRIFASQGIRFREVLIDPSFAHEGRDTRKPGTGLVRHWLADDGWSRAASAMIGDRETDAQFAANLGIRSFRLDTGEWNWDAIAHELCDAPRRARVERNTKETRIAVQVDLDRAAEPKVHTGLGFFDHMLEQIGKHGGFALELRCDGDTHIDEHHTIEDCALALGSALRQALGDKRGIGRYGDAAEGGAAALSPQPSALVLPMDETIARAALDLSGRAYFVFDGTFPRDRVGDIPTELVPHFFRSLCDTLGANLHLAVRGDNAHHMVEACFKAVARALRVALRREGSELPSTKGAL
ncbi:MAG: bifunctional histidinol-phosphatase/imidazoleglycerol-phosphate dehydratase HisB [Proteobacteria bacterium]|uniref:bifunctional histidinol-phosphatase/imidazoleglycerol-phosphate dehydratase HisB n=1 Tax=Rudaea sp. TaxID=2136325 RepID=UPI00322030D1|nr:bifunctional histidinol-phosphatase/imidazoleglycerol-phosphate dehydratase HisB [Pseudomonadota bacterium]